MGAAKRVVDNIEDIDLAIERLIASLPPAPPQARLRLAAWARSRLRRHIIHELDCARPCPRLPPCAPPWLRRRFESGEAIHHVDLPEEVLRLLLAALALLSPIAERRPIERFDPAPLLERAHCRLVWLDCSGPLDPGRERQALALPDGRSWVELLDEPALAREGLLMRHCAGRLEPERARGESRLFSLRDPKGRPRLTLELHHGRLRQLRGKAQSLLSRSDWPAVEAFLSLGLQGCSERASECLDLTSSGCVWDPPSRSLLDIERLPDGWLFRHDLLLRPGGPSRLPEGSRVAGELVVEEGWAGRLPSSLFARSARLRGPIPLSPLWRFGELFLSRSDPVEPPADIALFLDLSEAPSALAPSAPDQPQGWAPFAGLLLPDS